MASLTVRPTGNEHELLQTAYEMERAERLRAGRPIISMSRWMNKILIVEAKRRLGGIGK